MIFIYQVFVYLPIVLLITYSLSEMVWSHKLTTHPSWVFSKSFFLLMGTSISYLVISMGDNGLLDVRTPHIQNGFFIYAVILYSILSGAYILKLLRVTWPHDIGLMLQKNNIGSLFLRFIIRIQKFLLDTHFVHILAFIGLLLLLVSMLLGQIVTLNGF